MTLAARIKRLRDDRNLARQIDLAELIGVDQSTVSRWERGARPEPEELLALAKLAGKGLEEFLAEAESDVPVHSVAGGDLAEEPASFEEAPTDTQHGPSSLDVEITLELHKAGVTDPQRISQAVRNLHKVFARRKTR